MQLRVPLNFQLSLSRKSFRECTEQNCSELPLHSHYQSTDLNSFFRSIMLKPTFTWFLALKAARLQILSIVYQNALKKKTNSIAYTMQKSPNLDKP